MTSDQQAAWNAMEEALKPFADQAHLVDDDNATPAYDTLNLCGDYRRAAKAYALAQANKPREVDG